MRTTDPGTTPVIHTVDRFPDLLALHRFAPERYPCLLESVGADRGEANRFDILFAFPGPEIRLDPHLGLRARSAGGEAGSPPPVDPGGRFLEALDVWFRACRSPLERPTGLPFHGGWFLYLGYELAVEIEPCLRRDDTLPGHGPVALARRFPAAIVRDRRQRCCHLVTEAWLDSSRLELMRRDLEPLSPGADPSLRLSAVTEEDPRVFTEAVGRALAYIREGDVFQVNLSRPWTGRLTGVGTSSDAELYDRLRATNPGPFAGIARIDPGHVVMSSSPERLVRVSGDRVETRPIAGTRPRAEGLEADRRLAERLMAHPKERAEHIMLIDLERNDLGRICRPGTIAVDELMVLESYRHVHHIVSNVGGRLRPGVGPAEVIAAVFPGGTITGCPKVRCMEIIAELEGRPRGAYTGSMGYLNLDGSLDLNILIRTLERRDEAIEFRAGAGIVADSIPERELDETRDKARGLLMAMVAG